MTARRSVLDKLRPLWAYLSSGLAEPAQVARSFERARRMRRRQAAVGALFAAPVPAAAPSRAGRHP